MASKKKQSAPEKKQPQPSAGGKVMSVYNFMEEFLQARSNTLFYILLGISFISGLVLFDMRLSIGGDDATYIQRAHDFLKKGIFPFEQGPLYPLTLSIFVKLFGINLFVLKFVSCLFLNLAFFFTYKALKGRIPYLLLFLLLSFMALNAFYQYFASVTYTEAFFLLMQSVAILFSLKLIDLSNTQKLNYKTDWKLVLLVGLFYLLISLTKTVAIICVFPLFAYFMLQKKWDYVIGSFAAFAGLKILYELTVRSIYGAPDVGQFQSMFLVDLYKPQLGYETAGGMITRFFDNANTYLSARFFSIIYLRSFQENFIAVIPSLAYFLLALIAGFTYLAYLRNKVVFFISLYVLSLIGAVFFGIQSKNTQWRLIIIIVPYLILLFMFGFYQLTRKEVVLQVLFIGFFGFIIVSSLYNTAVKSATNFPILKENMKGNRYAGFTPDWVNYLRASEWCGDSIPEGEGIIARKHSMSFIYGNGREFTPIYQVPAYTKDSIITPDSMMTFVQQYHCKYVILAQLRANPLKKDPNQIVNTINVIMGRIHDKYPEKFKLVHSEGKDEMAEVYEMLF